MDELDRFGVLQADKPRLAGVSLITIRIAQALGVHTWNLYKKLYECGQFKIAEAIFEEDGAFARLARDQRLSVVSDEELIRMARSGTIALTRELADRLDQLLKTHSDAPQETSK